MPHLGTAVKNELFESVYTSSHRHLFVSIKGNVKSINSDWYHSKFKRKYPITRHCWDILADLPQGHGIQMSGHIVNMQWTSPHKIATQGTHAMQ